MTEKEVRLRINLVKKLSKIKIKVINIIDCFIKEEEKIIISCQKMILPKNKISKLINDYLLENGASTIKDIITFIISENLTGYLEISKVKNRLSVEMNELRKMGYVKKTGNKKWDISMRDRLCFKDEINNTSDDLA